MARPTIVDGGNGARTSPVQQFFPPNALTAGLVTPTLPTCSLPWANTDGALLLACVKLLCYDDFHGDHSTTLATLTDLLNREMNQLVTQNTPKAARLRSPAVNSPVSTLPSTSANVSASAASSLFPSTDEKSEHEPYAHLYTTEASVRDTHGYRKRGKIHSDAIEAVSATFLPQCTTAVSQRGLRSSDSSTSTKISHSSSRSRSSAKCADGHQRWRGWITSSSPRGTCGLRGPFVEDISADDCKSVDDLITVQPKVRSTWPCGEQDITVKPTTSTAAGGHVGHTCYEADERARRSDAAALTGSDPPDVFFDGIIRTPRTRQSASASCLYKPASFICTTLQQQQHLQGRRIALGAPATLYHADDEELSVVLPACSPCATGGPPHNVCARGNGSHTVVAPVSGRRTSTLHASVVAGDLHPTLRPDCPPGHQDRLSENIDHAQPAEASSGFVKSGEQKNGFHVREEFSVPLEAGNCLQPRVQRQTASNAFLRKLPGLRKPYTLVEAGNSGGSSLKDAVQDIRRSTETYIVGTKTANCIALGGSNFVSLASADHLVRSNTSDGTTGGGERDEVRRGGLVEVHIATDNFHRRAERNQVKVTIETNPKKNYNNRDGSDYLQMAKKLPKFAGVIFDRLHKRWVSTYHDKKTRKVMRKYFGVRKHGFEHAYQMAVEHRKSRMLERQNDCDSSTRRQHEISNFCARAATATKEGEDQETASDIDIERLLAGG